MEPKAGSFAVNRRVAELEPAHPVCATLRHRRTLDGVTAVSGGLFGGVRPAPDIPVELREYPPGAAMGWHQDDCLHPGACQLECVLTVTNTSDSVTQYRDARTGRVLSIRTEPNSIIVLRASGPWHRATPVTRGRRTMLKFALAVG